MINSELPLITIGITAHNAASTLSRAIDSALAQSWPNKEIIIVDDASKDATRDVIERYAGTSATIRAFRQEMNLGVAAARNVILKNAAGAYVAFFDDDDISLFDRLEKQYKALRPYDGQLVLCHTARTQIYPGEQQRTEPTPACHGHPVKGRDMFERILLGKKVPDGFGSLATCSLMMPRTTFESVGLYDESFRRSEDMDYTLRTALKNGIFIGLDEPLVIQTMTHANDKKLQDEKYYHEKIYAKYEAHLGTSKTRFALEWLELRYDFLRGRKFKFLQKIISLFLRHPVMALSKIRWAMPNLGFNLLFSRFHKENA